MLSEHLPKTDRNSHTCHLLASQLLLSNDIKMLCTKRYLITVHSIAEKQSQTYVNSKEACGFVGDQDLDHLPGSRLHWLAPANRLGYLRGSMCCSHKFALFNV